MRKILGTITCTFLFGLLTLNGQTKNLVNEQDFKNPLSQYKPMPFWHMNGDLKEDEILRQMTDAHDAGFSGLSILPVHSTLPDFLSDEYFKRYQYILETAKSLDMEIILYDDTGFPSGNAGGRIERDYPHFVRKSLEKYEYELNKDPFFKAFIPEGELMAAIAMNMDTKERIDLSEFIKDNLLSWPTTREQGWKVMLFMCQKATFWKSDMPLDAMNPAAVKQFINLTYDKYEEKFGSYFGNTIKLTFFDDVGFYRKERTWTEAFNQKFMALNNYDPTLYYPALWYDIGEETEAARVAFFNTRAELLSEGYPKYVTEWTKKRGLKNTGHPPGNYDIQPVDMHGDIFKYFRHTDLPLTDAIIWYNRGREGFKLVSSAADAADKPIVSTEVYGAFREQKFDSIVMYRTIMELFARGVNFVVPHGMWYNPKKMGIPPLFSPLSDKLRPALLNYSEYVGRSCYLLQGGRRIADIGIIYPITSLQAGYYFDEPTNTTGGDWAYPEADYQKVGDILTNDIRRDFSFIHPEQLVTDKYIIEKGNLHLNNKTNYQDYKLIIIPGGKVIALKTLQKIKAFYDAGGKVIATSLLPSMSSEMNKNEEVVAIVNDMFGAEYVKDSAIRTNKKGGKTAFIPNPSREVLSDMINQLVPNEDVGFETTPEITSAEGVFSYMHKVKDGKNLYFFANSSDDTINTEVLLRGKLNLNVWN
ncbi:MAG: glycosyl hydrolase, partial [Maribacter sp.]